MLVHKPSVACVLLIVNADDHLDSSHFHTFKASWLNFINFCQHLTTVLDVVLNDSDAAGLPTVTGLQRPETV